MRIAHAIIKTRPARILDLRPVRGSLLDRVLAWLVWGWS